MKCVNCKHCIGFENGYYWCDLLGDDEIELVEEWCANDDEMYCQGYIDEFEEVYGENSNDDFTEKS